MGTDGIHCGDHQESHRIFRLGGRIAFAQLKLADIIIVKTNPLQDIRSIENVDKVFFIMKGGKILKDQRNKVM